MYLSWFAQEIILLVSVCGISTTAMLYKDRSYFSDAATSISHLVGHEKSIRISI